ncbi:DMT family transporter [Neobacillus sp. PS3-34]|uniref:DMT family transporter n=1 Tax=Neobacillus sp. PS3-34 TaxID=3070678 RepID=UPI0027E138DD|nr:DMT family transporter [Neobacillus sp. PS3-34]WML48735.1 DMT family transporter [Neobacillus sp. PS3-34]
MLARNNKALISLFLVSVLWGCNYPVSAYLLKGFSPVFLSTVRICFTSLFLIIVALTQKGMRKPTVSEWKFLVGVGIFGTLFNQTFYFTGLHHTTPANASLIIALSPIATIILERIVFKIKFTIKKASGAFISLLGVFSIIGVAGGSFRISFGDLNVLVAMICLSISLLFIRGLSKTMNSFVVTVYATVLGSVLMIPAAGVESLVSGSVISHSPFMWILLICAGIIAQGIAGFWWNKGVAEVGAGTASMFMNLQPFVAIIASHFVLGNPIMLTQIFGGILVLLGVFIANLPSGKPVLAIEPNKSA